MRIFRPLTFAAPSLLMALVGACVAQTVESFDGDSGIPWTECKMETNRCWRQPEMDVSVDGKHVVQVTRQNMNVYDYAGKLQRSSTMIDVIRAAGLDPMPPVQPNFRGGNSPFEPHVVFDEFIQRWIITVTCLSDCVLVSATADPLGTWKGVYLSCLQSGPCLNYDPGMKLGYDRNGVYVCGAHINDDDPNTAPKTGYDCFAVPSAEVRAIGEGKEPAHLNRRHNLPIDVVPAIDHNPRKAANAAAFFVAKSCRRDAVNACMINQDLAFDWLVDTFTWKGTTGSYNNGGEEQRVKTDVGSKRSKWLYNFPCCGPRSAIPQGGTDMALRSGGSHRLMNIFQSGTHLHGASGSGACTHDCGEQGADKHNLMFYVDLDCTRPQACVVAQTAKIASPDEAYLFATVGVDAKGNVGIVASSVGPATHLSVKLWTRRKNDPPNTFSGPKTVVSGTQPYTCPPPDNVTLLGSAVGVLTALDPSDGTRLWTNAQWANDARPCAWNTRIVSYSVVPPPKH